MTGLGIAVAVVLLLWCALLYVPFRWRPVGIYLITEKSLAAGYVPFIAAAGMALAAADAVFGEWWIAVPARVAAVGALVVIVRIGAARVDLSGALGTGWEDRIPPERRARMIRRWWTGRLRSDPEPRLRRDVPFATVPGAGRVLLCDVNHGRTHRRAPRAGLAVACPDGLESPGAGTPGTASTTPA